MISSSPQVRRRTPKLAPVVVSSTAAPSSLDELITDILRLQCKTEPDATKRLSRDALLGRPEDVLKARHAYLLEREANPIDPESWVESLGVSTTEPPHSLAFR